MTDHHEDLDELRKRAEQRLDATLADPLAVTPAQLPHMAHELQVRQIELEMQHDELRRSYRELEDARYRFEDLFDQAPLGYFILHDTGQIVQTNISSRCLLGVEHAALVGRRFHYFVTEEYRDTLHLHLRRVFRSTGTLNCEIEMQRQDGSRFVAQLNSKLHPHRQERRKECLTVVLDISEQKAAEVMMQKAQEASEEASADKTRFLAAASHDIRQPLQALTSIGELLRQSLHDPEDLELLKLHSEALTNMRELLDALLDVSRLDAGAIRPNVEAFPIAPLLQKLAAQHRLAAKKKGLELRVAPCSAVVQSDLVLLRQMLDNLVANAIRYTESGGVLVGCRRSGDAVRVEVWDTGVGIPGDEKGRIFEDFYQVGHPAGHIGKGLGLGLSIVQRTARLLTHALDVRTSNQGSMFALTIPLGQATFIDRKAPLSGQFNASCRPGEATVLLVDDDNIVRKATALVLERFGYHVISATDGVEALRKIGSATRHPDILLTDFRLAEGETGLQVIEAVHDFLGTAVPALIFTGDIELSGLSEVTDNPWMVFQKPVDPQTLNRVIKGLLSQG